MKIVVIGTGYVGLVAGTCFAETGNNVCCVDIDKGKISRLRDGDPVIYEPGLETQLKKNIKAGRLEFTDSAKEKVGDCDIIFLAVGTPTDKDGSADLSYLLGSAKGIAPYLKGYTLVVNKCTAPVGTIHKIKDILSSGIPSGVKFDVASNPEFLKEGVAVQDFMYPDRVVLGVETERAAKILYELYEPFVRNGNPIHTIDIKSAELTKYACNCFLATKISFINDIAALCEKLGADINSVRAAMATDQRIGKHFLYSGVGYGGSCFPKDVQALISTGSDCGLELPLIRSADKINTLQRKRFLQKVIDYFNGDVKDKVIAVWGLAFKPQTDDMREAPSIYIIEELMKRGSIVKASDPVAIKNAKQAIRGNVQYFENHLDAVKDADALLLLTEWNEYRSFDGERLKAYYGGKVIFDGRNIWHSEDIKAAGYDYYGIGRS
ncbi:MAG: UDP-glucose/GDP-mannose dehydrogenase family protein [Proteobacteria bacterium]|nr:UDP-glucose/GDP-mannose dehydrogenase family protein [Pseudomonadota bacterium]